MEKEAPALSFRDWLSKRSDVELAQILRNRPDTALPLPPGIGSLAARLQLRASVMRAVHRLNALELAVLEAAAAEGAELHPVSSPAVHARITESLGTGETPSPDQLHAAVDKLRDLALIFGDEDFMVVSEVMPSLPSHWQLLPDPRGHHLAPGDAERLVAELPPRKRKILDTLVDSGGFGLTRDASLTADPARPIPQLIAEGLLARVDDHTVKLPPPVRRALEGRDPLPQRIVPLHSSPAEGSDDQGLAAGLDVARLMRQLITALGTAPASTLKGGAVGVRVVTRLTRELDIDEAALSRLVSLGVSARLLALGVPDPLPTDDDGGDYLAPTDVADEWLRSDLGAQLTALLQAWWSQTIAAWLVGTPDDKGKPTHLLSAATIRESLPSIRHLMAASLCRVHISDLGEDMFFQSPVLAARIATETVTQLLDEARWIGAVADDHPTSALHALVAGSDLAEAVQAPRTVDHLILQGDMTVLVPGPLDQGMQDTMDTIANLESSGLASVYRITEESLRRALDSGLTATDISGFLAAHSPGEVPQSITYMLNDVARRHGSLRGGPAMSYVRCDDAALLLQAIDAGQAVALRQIAPTVAVSQAPLAQVIACLRKKGLQPVAEDALGASLDITPDPSRVEAPEAPRSNRSTLDESRIQAAVAAIRREDAAFTGSSVTEKPETLSVLQQAARAGRTVTLGFVDKQGVAVHRVVKPVTVNAGQVDAIDESTGSVHRFMLHRITEVTLD